MHKIYDTTKSNVIESTKSAIQVATLNETLSPMMFVFHATQEFKEEGGRLIAVEPITININVAEYVLLSSLPKDLQEQVRANLPPKSE